MDNFISLSDYDASIHRDILDALLRKDTTAYDPQIIEVCEDRAVASSTKPTTETLYSPRVGQNATHSFSCSP